MTTIAVSERKWCDTPSNIGRLIRHLDQQGICAGWDAQDYARLCDEPWHWDQEWNELLALERQA